MIRRPNRVTATPPAPVHTQAQQRVRRRQRLGNHLVGTFRLDTEIADVAGPLAVEITGLRDPRAMRQSIETAGQAVADLIHTAAGLVAESRAADGQIRRAAADLATRPRQPSITDEQIVNGTWIEELILYAGKIAVDLAALLDRALPPEAPALRGELSASERLERALREFDRASTVLARRIPEVRRRQALPSMDEYNQQQRDQAELARVERELTRFGVPS